MSKILKLKKQIRDHDNNVVIRMTGFLPKENLIFKYTDMLTDDPRFIGQIFAPANEHGEVNIPSQDLPVGWVFAGVHREKGQDR